MTDLKEINQLLEIDVNAEGGLKSRITGEDREICERTQEKLTQLVVHTSDLGFLSRSMDVAKIWVDLLFQEFFHQGDMER